MFQRPPTPVWLHRQPLLSHRLGLLGGGDVTAPIASLVKCKLFLWVYPIAIPKADVVFGFKVSSFISNQVKDIFSLPDQGPLHVFKLCELIPVYFHALVTTDKVNNVV